MSRIYPHIGAGAIVDFLARIEVRLLQVAERLADDAIVQNVAMLLQDISDFRMKVEVPSAVDARLNARVRERAMIYVLRDDGTRVEAALCDLSTGGALITSDTRFVPREKCNLVMPGILDALGGTVAAIGADTAHIVFDKPNAEEAMRLAKHIERVFQRY